MQYLDDNAKSVYKDEYTGEVIPMHLVREAMEEELAYFNENVWDATPRKDAEILEGYKLVRMRWVICDKGDSDNPDVRARLVACGVGNGKSDEFFASTPPLEAKRLLFSEYAKRARHPKYKDADMVISFVDVRKAYFNGVPRRKCPFGIPDGAGNSWLPRCAS